MQPAQSQNQGKGGATGLSVNASMSMNNAHIMLNMAAGAPGGTAQATATSSQLAQHKVGPYKNVGASGPLQGGSANRRKQRLVSAIPQTAEGKQPRHARGAAVAQSLIHDGNEGLTVPTGRLPLKAHDGTASHAPATSADLSHLSANLQGKPG